MRFSSSYYVSGEYWYRRAEASTGGIPSYSGPQGEVSGYRGVICHYWLPTKLFDPFSHQILRYLVTAVVDGRDDRGGQPGKYTNILVCDSLFLHIAASRLRKSAGELLGKITSQVEVYCAHVPHCNDHVGPCAAGHWFCWCVGALCRLSLLQCWSIGSREGVNDTREGSH